MLLFCAAAANWIVGLRLQGNPNHEAQSIKNAHTMARVAQGMLGLRFQGADFWLSVDKMPEAAGTAAWWTLPKDPGKLWP